MEYREVKIFGGFFLITILIMLVVFLWDFKLDLDFDLYGESVILDVFDEYNEVGYKASFLGKDLTDIVDVNNNVNSEVIGTYFVYYHIKYLWFEKSAKRRVMVIDREEPSISLVGGSSVGYNLGDKYTEFGYSATDNYDGDISDKVEIESNVNTGQAGTYLVKYSVKDSSGNECVINREVIVKNKKEVFINNKVENNKGIIYLTFDDGPSASVTSKILDILKKKGVKATFFVVNHGKELDHLIKREYNEGHTVGIHSYSHDYSLIYKSKSNYFNDLEKMVDRVEDIIGVKSNIIRFPGGSSNSVSKRYKEGIMSELVVDVIDKGYKYYDWNVDSGDAGGAKSKEDIYNNVISGLSINRENMVLMHDFEDNYITLNALEDIIDYGKSNGYTFKAITNDTNLVKHKVFN